MQGEHKHIEEFKVFDNKGLLLIFEDGSHTYIDPENVSNIIHAVIMIAFDEYENEDLPFPEED